jgi:hypothetical protein
MRAVVALVVCALVVAAGCTAPVHEGGDGSPGSGDGPAVDPAGDESDDELGVEGGVRWNDSIDVNQSDGLSDAEVARYVNRTMARVELVRGLEFESGVSVEVVSREEFRRSINESDPPPERAAWRNQVWEAAFAVGEDRDVTEAFDRLYGTRVLGFYRGGNSRLVVVSETGGPVISNGTLAHELVHALQDQHQRPLGARMLDRRLARQGVMEGEARYVEQLYLRRCGVEWDCVATPEGARFDPDAEVNQALLFTVLHPYSDGAVYVHRLHEQGGWDAVDAAYGDPPNSTEQVIHPDRDDEPATVEVRDAARGDWRRFGGANTLGEAAIYVLFWYQASEYGAETGVDPDAIHNASGAFDAYDYDAEPSAGWAGDALVPYRNGDRFGYVWATEWDSEADAREFRDAYLAVLDAHGAERRGPDTWMVPDGPFADAFRVTVDGTRVTVVNAPTEAELSDVHPRE